MRKKSMVMTAMLSMSCIMAFMAAGCSKKIPEKTNHVVVETQDTETEIMTEKESEEQTGTEEQTNTEAPAVKPTEPATETPTEATSVKPTEVPTQIPVQKPTEAPTQASSVKLTEPATEAPTQEPAVKPTEPETETPTQAPSVKPTEPATEATTEAPAVKPTEPATEAPTQAPAVKPTEPATEAPTETPTEAPTEKSIWDYPFDVEAIRAQLIEWGEDIGLTHVTEYEGWGPATPENSSYDLPTYISKTACGEQAKKKLKEWVEYTPVSIYTYGGPKIKYFTIWMEEYEDGFIQIYFLY